MKAVVLAAGKGTRMKSELPKVLVPVCGRPMVEYVLEALRAAGVEEILLVVGYRSDLVRQQLAAWGGLTFVEQPEQLGTGHAVMMCRPYLADQPTGVIVLAGDSPLVQVSSLRALIERFDARRPACLLATAHKDNPQGLGRIVRDATGRFVGIVEEKDATDAQRQITEVNMSTYAFSSDELLFALDRIRADNAQREYYLTDCPGVLIAAGKPVEAEPLLSAIETLSINNMDELAEVERAMQALRGS